MCRPWWQNPANRRAKRRPYRAGYFQKPQYPLATKPRPHGAELHESLLPMRWTGSPMKNLMLYCWMRRVLPLELCAVIRICRSSKPSAAEPELVALQRDLIARAVGWLAQGGVFVFATCSLFPEEGELQADWIKQTLPNLQPAPLLAEDYGFPNAANDARGGLRLRPDFWADLGGMDGFYIVKYTYKNG